MQRNQTANIHWFIEKASKFQNNIYFCFIDYTKAFVWITTNSGKFFKWWEYQTTWSASWEICVQVKKQQLEPDMEQQTGSKLGKEYVKAVYRHPAYLTNMESSVQFSRSVVSDSLQPQGLQHARPPCPSLSSLSQSLLKLMSIESVMPSNLSHPLSSPSPPALSLSQHQGLFKWVSSLHKVDKVLEFQLQHQSFQWTPRTDFLFFFF